MNGKKQEQQYRSRGYQSLVSVPTQPAKKLASKINVPASQFAVTIRELTAFSDINKGVPARHTTCRQHLPGRPNGRSFEREAFVVAARLLQIQFGGHLAFHPITNNVDKGGFQLFEAAVFDEEAMYGQVISLDNLFFRGGRGPEYKRNAPEFL